MAKFVNRHEAQPSTDSDSPAAPASSPAADVVVEPAPADRSGTVSAGELTLRMGESNSLEFPGGKLSLGKNGDVARVFFTRLVSDNISDSEGKRPVISEEDQRKLQAGSLSDGERRRVARHLYRLRQMVADRREDDTFVSLSPQTSLYSPLRKSRAQVKKDTEAGQEANPGRATEAGEVDVPPPSEQTKKRGTTIRRQLPNAVVVNRERAQVKAPPQPTNEDLARQRLKRLIEIF